MAGQDEKGILKEWSAPRVVPSPARPNVPQGPRPTGIVPPAPAPKTPQTIPGELSLMVPFYAMHLLDQEPLAHYRGKAEVQDQQIRGLNALGRDIDKYKNDWESLMAKLTGDIEAHIGKRNIPDNWILYVVVGLIAIAVIAYFYVHPEVVAGVQQYFAQNGVALTVTILLIVVIVLLVVWRRRGRKGKIG